MRQTISRLQGRLGRRALILLYHRVAELAVDPWSLAVRPQTFAGQMRVLRERFVPLPLAALAARLPSGRLPAGAVAVTFDDGYADFLSGALPVLEQYEIPVTLFVPGTGEMSEFWWDVLEKLILLPDKLPGELDFPAGGPTWRLGASARPGSPGRLALFMALWERLQVKTAPDQDAYLAALHDWAGVQPVSRKSHRRMSAAELAQAAAHPLVEIGGHSLTHACLAALQVDDQRREIEGNKTYLEDLTGQPVISFAYPYGRPVDYTPETVALVREAGYSCACANVRGAAHRGSDLYQLPRLFITGEPPATFAARVEQTFSEIG